MTTNTTQGEKKEGLLSVCCRADFDPFGFDRPDCLWQEKCLKCGKECEVEYFS